MWFTPGISASPVSPYQVLAGISLISGFLLSLWLCRQAGFRNGLPVHLLCVGAPFIFAGGKVGYLLVEGRLGDPGAWQGPGYSLFGSLFLVLLVWLVSWAFIGFPLLPFLDCVTPAAALGLFLARVGCYLNGCCSGVECSLPWAVRFPAGTVPFLLQVKEGRVVASAAESLPVHPYQLYEAAFGLILFGILLTMAARKMPPGSTFFAGALAYGLFRFLVEPLRADFHPLMTLGGLSLSQVLSLGTLLMGLGGIVLLTRWKR